MSLNSDSSTTTNLISAASTASTNSTITMLSTSSSSSTSTSPISPTTINSILTTTSSNSRAPPQFPTEHERRQFPTWAFQFESFIASRRLTLYLTTPILHEGESPTPNTTYI